MEIIDGKGTPMGRLASYVAKQAIKGKDIVILNCNQVIITGNKKEIKDSFNEKKGKIGSGQKGPKYSKTPYKIVKRTIRGMLPNHRGGRGKMILKRIICYNEVPKEFADSKKITLNQSKKMKYINVEEILKD